MSLFSNAAQRKEATAYFAKLQKKHHQPADKKGALGSQSVTLGPAKNVETKTRPLSAFPDLKKVDAQRKSMQADILPTATPSNSESDQFTGNLETWLRATVDGTKISPLPDEANSTTLTPLSASPTAAFFLLIESKRLSSEKTVEEQSAPVKSGARVVEPAEEQSAPVKSGARVVEPAEEQSDPVKSGATVKKSLENKTPLSLIGKLKTVTKVTLAVATVIATASFLTEGACTTDALSNNEACQVALPYARGTALATETAITTLGHSGLALAKATGSVLSDIGIGLGSFALRKWTEWNTPAQPDFLKIEPPLVDSNSTALPLVDQNATAPTSKEIALCDEFDLAFNDSVLDYLAKQAVVEDQAKIQPKITVEAKKTSGVFGRIFGSN